MATVVLATGLVAGTNEIAISLKQTVIIELAQDADGTVVPKIVDQPAPGVPVVVFQFTKDRSARMLKVENRYDRDFLYSGRMCISKRKVCAKTTFVPVYAGISSFETWNDPIDLLILGDFRLEVSKPN